MNGASPAVPVWIVPDADLKVNGGDWYVEGRAAIPISGSVVPPAGSVTAAMIDSEASTNGQVLTADGAGGASWEDAGGGGSVMTLKIPLTAAVDDTPGAVCAVLNPFAIDVVIMNVFILVGTPGDERGINFGIVNNATTAADNLGASVASHIAVPNPAGFFPLGYYVLWQAGKYLTGTADGELNMADANLHVQYVAA